MARAEGRASLPQILGASLTAAATLLGGGGAVVPLQLQVRESGYMLAPLLILAGGVWTIYTSWILLELGGLMGADSYEAIAFRTLGWIGSWTVSVVIIVNAFLICVSTLGLAVDMIHLNAPFDAVDRVPLMLIAAVVLLPLTAVIRRVDRLEPLSFVTAATALIFLGFIIRRSLDGLLPSSQVAPFTSGPDSDTVWIDAFCTMTIAFVVQFNVLPVANAFPSDGWKGSMMLALFIGIGLTFLIYATTDLLSYLTFGHVSYDTIMEDYRHMTAGGFATAQLGLGQLLSYPILAHAAVTESSKWLEPCCAMIRHARSSDAAPAQANEKSELLDTAKGGVEAGSQQEACAEESTLTLYTEACMSELIAGSLWVFITTIVSAAIPDVSAVLSLTGALCATPLMTVFPPLMILLSKEWASTSSPLATIAHGIMLLLGCMTTVAGLIVAIKDMLS